MMTTERVASGVAGEMERGRGPDGSAPRRRPGARRAAYDHFALTAAGVTAVKQAAR